MCCHISGVFNLFGLGYPWWPVDGGGEGLGDGSVSGGGSLPAENTCIPPIENPRHILHQQFGSALPSPVHEDKETGSG